MSDNLEKKIIIIGTGLMAIEYAKVLVGQNTHFTVIGRGQKSSDNFTAVTGIETFVGGIENYLKENTLDGNTSVVIATGTEVLMPILKIIMLAGAGRVLIEKPAAISIEELLENEEILKPFLDKVYVAYNRRFYASVLEAQRLIEEDQGLQSLHFEFTEWSHIIEPIPKPAGVKENWFFANSTHVVDLAFHIAGTPINWNSYSKSGNIAWHKVSNFVGAGITDKDVLFSYISNWESAGRWAIELLTYNRRIYLKPLEGIQIQNKGSVNLQNHDFDLSNDTNFKPGLYLQVQAFMAGDNKNMVTLGDHINRTKNIFAKILNN